MLQIVNEEKVLLFKKLMVKAFSFLPLLLTPRGREAIVSCDDVFITYIWNWTREKKKQMGSPARLHAVQVLLLFRYLYSKIYHLLLLMSPTTEMHTRATVLFFRKIPEAQPPRCIHVQPFFLERCLIYD